MRLIGFAAFGVDPRALFGREKGALPPAAKGGSPRSIFTKKKEAAQ